MVLRHLGQEKEADKTLKIGTNRLNTWFVKMKDMELTEERALEVVLSFEQGKTYPWHPKQ